MNKSKSGENVQKSQKTIKHFKREVHETYKFSFLFHLRTIISNILYKLNLTAREEICSLHSLHVYNFPAHAT